VADETFVPWDDFVRRQQVADRCTLLDPRRARVPAGSRFVTRCGDATYLSYSEPTVALRAYTRLLAATEADLEEVRRLPDCPTGTGTAGPFPPAGRLACLDLGDATAVVWFNEHASMVGIARIDDDARAAWRDYGPDWPPFVR
jgi:hypothetical protein